MTVRKQVGWLNMALGIAVLIYADMILGHMYNVGTVLLFMCCGICCICYFPGQSMLICSPCIVGWLNILGGYSCVYVKLGRSSGSDAEGRRRKKDVSSSSEYSQRNV